MSINVLDVITEVIMTKKMIFVQYCPNDMWTGCSTLTGKAELAYRRICDLIYVQDNKLFDDEVTWEQVARPFYEDIAKIKAELINKDKIYIDEGKIRNKRCDLEIEKAKDKHQKAVKSAEARWGVRYPSGVPQGDTTPNANVMQTHSERNANTLTHEHTNTPTINHKSNIYTQEFDTFWRKYVLDYKDTRSVKWDSFQQWKKLDDTQKQSVGDKYVTYRNQKGDYYKALERFLRKKIYLEVTPVKEKTEDEMREWKLKGDIDMRKKGIKPLSWSVSYIEELDKAIANGET